MPRRKTREHIRRIDTRPQNRADVQAGVTGAHLGMGGELLGGYTPTGQALGTKDPSQQMGGGRVEARRTPGTTMMTDPNRAGGHGGGDPNGRLGGLDRWYAMNPDATPGKFYDEGAARQQARHRERMRKKAREMDIAQIQGTQSEEAELADRTGMAIRPDRQAEMDEREARDKTIEKANRQRAEMEARLEALDALRAERRAARKYRRAIRRDPQSAHLLGLTGTAFPVEGKGRSKGRKKREAPDLMSSP